MDKKMMPVMMLMILLMLVGIVFAAQGVLMHAQVPVEEAKFHALQESYFINSKAVRDGAKTGSALNQDLVQLQRYPSTLLELKLVGIGRILMGIFVVLFAILVALIMMPKRFGEVLRKNS